jgi:hypothetical protein
VYYVRWNYQLRFLFIPNYYHWDKATTVRCLVLQFIKSPAYLPRPICHPRLASLVNSFDFSGLVHGHTAGPVSPEALGLLGRNPVLVKNLIVQVVLGIMDSGLGELLRRDIGE